jgi:hypothetical protein
MAVSAPYDPTTGLNTTLPNALLTPDLSAQNADQQRWMLARALQQSKSASDYSPIQSPWQGAARLAEGLMSGLQIAAANRMQQTGTAATNTAFGNLFNSVNGGFHPMAGSLSDIPAAPPPAPGSPAPVAAAPTAAESNVALAGGERPVPPENIGVDQILTGIRTAEGVPYLGRSSTGAIGAYGLTSDFIKQWAPGAGLPTDRASYASNPNLQDQLATYAANQMHDKFGAWEPVANAWLTGSPTATTSAPGNMSPHAYVAKVMNAAIAATGQPSPQTIPSARPTQLAGDVPTVGAIPVPPARPDAIPPVPTAGPYGEPSFSKGEPGPPPVGALTPQERSALTNPPPPAPPAPPPLPPPGPPTAPHVGPVQTGNYKGQDYTYQEPAGQSQPVVPAGAASVPVPAPPPPPGLTPQEIQGKQALAEAEAAGAARNAALAGGSSPGAPVPAPAPVQTASAATAGPAIVVPGYEEAGKVTRAQADDSEGKPSTADWDAAFKGQSSASGAAAPPITVPATAPVAQRAPIASPTPPRAAPQAMAPVQQPSFLQSLANALGGGGGPITNSRYDPATGIFLPPAQQAQALAAALAGRPSTSPPSPAPSGLGDLVSSIFSPITGRSASVQPSTPPTPAQSAPTAAPPQSYNGVSPQNIKDAQTLLQSPYASPEYKKFAMEILERAVKPQPHVLTSAELTAAERATGAEYQLSAAGERSQVKGTEGDKTRAPNAEESARLVAAGKDPKDYQVADGKMEPIAPAKVDTRPAEIQEFEYDQKYRKENGLPAISPSDWHVMKMQGMSGIVPLHGADGQPIDESLSGADVLAAVPPDVGRMAQRMIDGRQSIPNLSVRTDPIVRQAVLAAQKADNTLDVGNATARVKVRNEFLAGGPSSPAARMTAGNNAINHIDEANYYAQTLHDLGYDTLNAAANAMTSGSSPVGLALKGYNTAVNNFAGEVVKFNTGSEGALEDRREKAALFSPNLTAGERKTAMESQIGILASNMTSLQKRWRDGMGPLVPDFETIHPDSLAAIERIKGNAPYPPPGGLPPSLREPTKGSQSMAAPAPVTAGASVSPVHVTSPDEARKLPPGTPIILPDGSTGMVPK